MKFRITKKLSFNCVTSVLHDVNKNIEVKISHLYDLKKFVKNTLNGETSETVTVIEHLL